MKESDFISSLLTRIPELDVEYAIEAMGSSELLYEKTLMHMVRQIPLNIDEMDDSLNTKNDLAAFAIKVHGIKSALRHVGKKVLANEAEALETAAKAGDREYCEGNYGAFREELMRFNDQVNEIAGQSAGSEADVGSGITNSANISDFIDILKQAGEAAELCDSISAYEILFPLTKMRFNENTDDLILKAANKLDQFKPYEAVEYITELLSKCEKPQQ